MGSPVINLIIGIYIMANAQEITESETTPLSFGQGEQAWTRYGISRSAFLKLRDNDPEFPTYFKRGRICVYNFNKLDRYFSA